MDTSDINFSNLYFLVHITMSFTEKKATNKIYLFLCAIFILWRFSVKKNLLCTTNAFKVSKCLLVQINRKEKSFLIEIIRHPSCVDFISFAQAEFSYYWREAFDEGVLVTSIFHLLTSIPESSRALRTSFFDFSSIWINDIQFMAMLCCLCWGVEICSGKQDFAAHVFDIIFILFIFEFYFSS